MIGSITKPMTTMLAAALVVASHVDPAAVAPYLRRYTQPTLGEVRITWRRDRLVRDAEGTVVSFTGGVNEPRVTLTIPGNTDWT